MNKLEHFLFNINLPHREPAVGNLLIAEPFLRESYFNHAVVCMIDCEKAEPSMGLIMNQPSPYCLGDVFESVPESIAKQKIMCGGPVDENRLFYLHTLKPMFANSNHVAGELFVGGDFKSVTDYIAEGMPLQGNIEFYLGYAGWEPLQLQEEIERNVWAVADMENPAQLLNCPYEKMWYRLVRSLGEEYKGWLFHPQYPLLN
ncbi:MAG: YqgE/AlgH family protein [Muribaculum sp.]|nr:YqgE/AlgH family protein [Muribaculaceae bacterium]MCM1080659.1 YqgE/AlgH family protein [Muribaculum sp.]